MSRSAMNVSCALMSAIASCAVVSACSIISGLDDYSLIDDSAEVGTAGGGGVGQSMTVGTAGTGGSGASVGSGGTGGAGGSPACGGSWAMKIAQAFSVTQPVGLDIDSQGNIILATGFVGLTDIDGEVFDAGIGADVLIVKRNEAGLPRWAKSFGSTDKSRADFAADVAIDAAGDVLLTGVCDSDINFGGAGEDLSLPSGLNTFIARLGSDGPHSWSWGYPSGAAMSMALSGQDVIVAGYITADLILPGAQNPPPFGGGADAAIIKIDGSDGQHVWARTFSDTNATIQEAGDVAVDALGNILVAGSFEDAVDFGGGNVFSATGTDGFVTKLSPGGVTTWVRPITGAGGQSTRSIGTYGGEVIVAGHFTGSVVAGMLSRTIAGSRNHMFLAKLDGDGEPVWLQAFGDPTEDQGAHSAYVDSQGRIFLTGIFRGELDLGGGVVLQDGGHASIFVGIFAPDGTALQGSVIGAGADLYSSRIAVDACGNIVLAGVFDGSLDFDGQVLADGAGVEIFLAKFTL